MKKFITICLTMSMLSSINVFAGANTYTVQRGDLFWDIAAKHNLTVMELVKANPQVNNPNALKAGDKINIPTYGKNNSNNNNTSNDNCNTGNGSGNTENNNTGNNNNKPEDNSGNNGSTGGNTENNNSSNSVSAFEKKVVELVNVQRKANGLQPLKLNTSLSNVARYKSEDMKNKNYFSHTSPTYGSPFDMLKQFNISYRTAGENIAKGQKTPEAVVNAWMNSEGHRKNILNKNFTEIGVGYVSGSSTYWTQLFIG